MMWYSVVAAGVTLYVIEVLNYAKSDGGPLLCITMSRGGWINLNTLLMYCSKYLEEHDDATGVI